MAYERAWKDVEYDGVASSKAENALSGVFLFLCVTGQYFPLPHVKLFLTYGSSKQYCTVFSATVLPKSMYRLEGTETLKDA
jgi:hypothetical protein